VNVFALQVLGHFNSTTLDDIRCLTLVVFPDDDFATLVLCSGNHGSPPHTLVIMEILAGIIVLAHATVQQLTVEDKGTISPQD
jgi:hypothetical protein